MSLDPFLDVLELEAEVPAEPVVGDGVLVSAGCASVDERLRDTEDVGDLFDVQVARAEEELKLLRRWLFVRSHRHHLAQGSEGVTVARTSVDFGALLQMS